MATLISSLRLSTHFGFVTRCTREVTSCALPLRGQCGKTSSEQMEGKRDMCDDEQTFKRASRATRASDPSRHALQLCSQTISAHQQACVDDGLLPYPLSELACWHASRSQLCKLPQYACKTESDRALHKHFLAIKRPLEAFNHEPSYILGGTKGHMHYDKLTEATLRANAVNNSVFWRRKSEGAASQTTRINCKPLGQAAAAQVVAVALCVATAKRKLRVAGHSVVHWLATNSVPACSICLLDGSGVVDDESFVVPSSTGMIYDANPCRLSMCTIVEICSSIARSELSEYGISNAMAQRTDALLAICESVCGHGRFDRLWSTWVLVAYLSSHPRGRALLACSGLTDVDLHVSLIFEQYGSEEIKRRARQRREKRACTTKERLELEEEETYKLLAPKHARGGRHHHCITASDGNILLEFWHVALGSSEVSVLHSLAAQSRESARSAALSTLLRQGGNRSSVACDEALKSVSSKNAEQSAEAAVHLSGCGDDNVPCAYLIEAIDPKTKMPRRCHSISRGVADVHNSAIHSCALPLPPFRPLHSTSVAMAWSRAVVHLSTDPHHPPGVAEAAMREETLRRGAQNAILKGCRAKQVKREADIFSKGTDTVLPTSTTGAARSFISLVSWMLVDDSHEEAADALVEEWSTNGRPDPDDDATNVLPRRVMRYFPGKGRREPVCTPAPALAAAIFVNETLRRWRTGRTRKNDPCMKLLVPSSPTELSKETTDICSSEPLPVLYMADFDLERLRQTEGRRARCAVGLHVCGDGALRIPEVVRNVVSAATAGLAGMERGAALHRAFALGRSALLVAASQSSYVGDLSAVLSASYANAAIASSKKVTVADMNKLMMLSPYDAYVAGLNNVHVSFEGTAYAGRYGPRVCMGFTPPGLRAQNLGSDKRCPGNCCLSTHAADQILEALSESQVVRDKSGVYYCNAPLAARGVPHGLVPGLHTALDEYVELLETVRVQAGRSDSDTVDGIFVLPYSAWTQSLPPNIEATVDPSLRACFRAVQHSSPVTGRAHLCDSTSDAEALVREPLFRRPEVVNRADNAFGSAYEYAATFFNAASTLSLYVQMYHAAHSDSAATMERRVQRFHAFVSRYVDRCDRSSVSASASLAADALVLLNCMYPSETDVGKKSILRGVALWPSAVAVSSRLKKAASLPCVGGLQAHHRAEALSFWNRFRRQDRARCAWNVGVAPLLVKLMELDGSHDLDMEARNDLRGKFEAAVRAAWLVASADGASRPERGPLASAASMGVVSRHHLDPVFFTKVGTDMKQGTSPIGLKAHSYRQVLALLVGASLGDERQLVEANVYANEGGLSLRVSADPSIPGRTAKAISPVQTESDHNAFGTREQKVTSAANQKKAWDGNALLCIPLMSRLSPPLPYAMLSRGESGCETVAGDFYQSGGGYAAPTWEAAEAVARMRSSTASSLPRVVANILDADARGDAVGSHATHAGSEE